MKKSKPVTIMTIKAPDRMASYFRGEWAVLLIVTVTGIAYNVGLTLCPWFEGQLAQTLGEIIGLSKTAADMLTLAIGYIAAIVLVQAMRYAKRYYVRRFANNVRRSMKRVLYGNLIRKPTTELEAEDVGVLMTKAISDVDACAEGMRKFTTEVFDTGVAMVAFLVMLLAYDWRLALICCIFPTAAYFFAEKLKKPVSRAAAENKESAGKLNGETLDRVSGALTYRVLGEEESRDEAYEKRLADYEKKAVRSGVFETALQPLYRIVSMASVIFIVWFGIKNVRGTGWTAWDIAAFTAFLSCFSRLALKSSKAAKLFNSVQKARVSWARIKPLMKPVGEDNEIVPMPSEKLTVEKLTFSYTEGKKILDNVSFTAEAGQIIGVTGAIASGKSTLGRIFLRERQYEGSIRFGDRELTSLSEAELCGAVAYMGHSPELLSDTIAENVMLGDSGKVDEYLKAVRIDREVSEMPSGTETKVGSGGIRLSGGQQARIALARTFAHPKPLIILDDPFSALDAETEREVFESLRERLKGSIVILISHRLYLFPRLDKVLLLDSGRVIESTHEGLLQSNAEYRALYGKQTGGGYEE